MQQQIERRNLAQMRAFWMSARRSMPSHPSQRSLSSKALGKLPAIQGLHPSVRDFALDLGQTQPCFALQPQDIQILLQPKDFLALFLVSLLIAFSLQ